MKKRWMELALCALLISLAAIVCAKQGDEGVLTLERVQTLAQKGEDLTWSDFEQYESRDVGSGLHIYKYDIDDSYYLLIGGILEEKPMYIYLVRAQDDDSIDIRTGDVEEFIKA